MSHQCCVGAMRKVVDQQTGEVMFSGVKFSLSFGLQGESGAVGLYAG